LNVLYPLYSFLAYLWNELFLKVPVIVSQFFFLCVVMNMTVAQVKNIKYASEYMEESRKLVQQNPINLACRNRTDGG